MSEQADGIARALVGRFTGGTLPLFHDHGRAPSGFLVERLDADSAPMGRGLPPGYAAGPAASHVLRLGHAPWGRALSGTGRGPHRAAQRSLPGSGDGGWYTKLDPGGAPLDTDKDLYAHAFVLFGLGSWLVAGGDPDDDRVAPLLDEGHRIVTEVFQRADGSFSECLDRAAAAILVSGSSRTRICICSKRLSSFSK